MALALCMWLGSDVDDKACGVRDGNASALQVWKKRQTHAGPGAEVDSYKDACCRIADAVEIMDIHMDMVEMRTHMEVSSGDPKPLWDIRR